MNNNYYQSGRAAKWSSLTEVLARMLAPITNMILARLLTPESFGVVTTVTMITSFADIFTDAGFQKYLIQHEFRDQKEVEDSANVAMWANFGVSVLLWFIIGVFSEQIAAALGCEGMGNVVTVACSILPMTSFSSIQRALFKRSFDYKTLFYVRMINVCIPLVVTVPLAFLHFQYWAMILGTICGEFANMLLLIWKSKWKPKFFFSMHVFIKMFSYSFWTMIESISIWLTSWIGIFIVGTNLNSYYVGLYKTSMSSVNSLMAVVTTAFTSVLFSLLSRYQNDNRKFMEIFYKYQKFVGSMVLPMGLGLFMYRKLATYLFLGSQWTEAVDFVGLWGLIYSISITFGHFCSEVYRAKGKPKLSVLAQWLHIIVLAPVCYFGAKRGFDTLIVWRSLIRLEFIAVHFVVMKTVFNVSVYSMIRNVKGAIIATVAMGCAAFVLQQFSDNVLYQIISIGICIAIYFIVYSKIENIKRVVEDVFSNRGEGNRDVC